MKLSVIIVNHNTGTTLGDCIDSFMKYESPADSEIIIVDNHSRDNPSGYIESIAGKYSIIKKIYLNRLESFSFANNRGFEISSGEYILIMNPDIIFTNPVIENLIQIFSEGKNIGAVCPALIGRDGKFQHLYFQRYPTVLQYIMFYTVFSKLFFKSQGLVNKYLENMDIDTRSGKKYFVEQIPFAFFLTKREIFEEAGMMDENLFLFFEDVDLSSRIAKKYKLVIDTSSRITHLGGASFTTDWNWKMYGRFIMSMNYYFDKHYNFIRAFMLKFFSVSNSLLVLTLEFIKKIFGEQDPERVRKHKRFIKLFKEYYL